ncbi:MAG: glycine zipper domain-containing protein [Sulfuricurvum sp.]|nr:glycine zipper domain-containing protein [Sulfuricurvum sp.]
MKKVTLAAVTLIVSMTMHAGNVDGSAVVGSALGAAAGSAIGSATGGKEGAVIGGGLGGALGAAVGSSKTSAQPAVRVQEKVIYVEGRSENSYREHHDNGKHKGQYKNKHHRD